MLSLLAATAWAAFSSRLAERWFHELAAVAGYGMALFVIAFVAILPGFMNAFVVASLALDRRPSRERLPTYPPVTIVIAAYNEAGQIGATLDSIARQDYPAEISIVVVNDGSIDRTGDEARSRATILAGLEVIDLPANAGKSSALNTALARVSTDLLVTVDADCVLMPEALRHLVERYLADPPGTRAVAGTVLVRNSRDTWITRAQEWDYFHGIAAIKRVQSLYHGTLVAQGAFSLYERAAVVEVGGWPGGVGEDIVLTWALLLAGHRVGHAEDACLFTMVPATLRQFVAQRRRWARGMLEAFNRHPGIVSQPRLSTLFILWNTFFPLLDFAYVFTFMPGVVLALFGHFWIAGPMTIALLPVALALNLQVHRIQLRMFEAQGLQVRNNAQGFALYLLVYGFVMQPASVLGYLQEFFHARKSWGTK